MNDKRKFVSLREAIQITGIGEQTLRKFVDQNRIDSYKTPSGHRKFDKDYLEKMCNSLSNDKKVQENKRQNYIYARVSSKKQFDDLNRQIEFIKNKRSEYSSYNLITDIASGINFKRKGLLSILDSAIQNTLGEVVVAHRDRLSRFGFDLIDIVVTKGGGKITVIDDERNKSTEQELSEDLLSIIHIYSCRQMGRRKYKSETDSKIVEDQIEAE
jgi:predicted site-specific integrase-resolvase